ncbi:hypothetical protein GWK41_08315 [Persephonella atlantica]|uniref:Uncharacterized protein n=1 Tax=Persephonella atlantica TaxID=2699429 RepID=A0ABS1GJL2_9AQUI|nr:hypothetical protein [Persephonella atlantica]MBK3333071.1 hypothetical protein [Persephonella atlantica]
MRTFLAIVVSIFIFSVSFSETTTTELLDEAQNSLKAAFESGCPSLAPYEYYKAETYYRIAVEETSKLNTKAGDAAAVKAIEWALKAMSKRYGEE